MLQDRTHDLTDRGGIKFIEENHLYLNAQGEQYISTTTLIKKYKSPFYTEDIAKYKAIKNILPSDKFSLLKKHAGGWENVYLFWDKLIAREEFQGLEEEKNNIINQWKLEAESGTAEHAKREREVIENGIFFNGKHYPHGHKTVLDVTKEDVCVLTEVLVWSHEHKLGGLADLLIFDKGDIYIPDYKTNKKIDMTSFMYKKMYPPLNHLLDCNYFHYSLQLSIYMKMAMDITGLAKGECYLINTANPDYGREKDLLIFCCDLFDEVNLIL